MSVKAFDKLKCSPRSEIESVSCYDINVLKKIAHTINKETSHKISDINKKDRKELWTEIYNIMSNISECKTETCWIKNDMLKHLSQEIKKGLRPFMPKKWETNKNEWLSTIDIAAALKQYEDAHKDFKLYGPTPIDFHLKTSNGQCKVDDLCAINIQKLLDDGIKKIGIVFNTDPHYKSGQHWISLYIDLYDENCIFGGAKRNKRKKRKHTKNKKSADKKIKKVKNGELLSEEELKNTSLIGNTCSGMYYFDSQGSPPPKNIVDLMENISAQADNSTHNIKFQKLYNDIQHQRKNTECGIYCIHFITSLLYGMKFKDYIKKVRNDEEMEKFRRVFFIDQRDIH